jgi:hypothetical protein
MEIFDLGYKVTRNLTPDEMPVKQPKIFQRSRSLPFPYAAYCSIVNNSRQVKTCIFIQYVFINFIDIIHTFFILKVSQYILAMYLNISLNNLSDL